MCYISWLHVCLKSTENPNPFFQRSLRSKKKARQTFAASDFTLDTNFVSSVTFTPWRPTDCNDMAAWGGRGRASTSAIWHPLYTDGYTPGSTHQLRKRSLGSWNLPLFTRLLAPQVVGIPSNFWSYINRGCQLKVKAIPLNAAIWLFARRVCWTVGQRGW